jgi:putative copper resistance protein D
MLLASADGIPTVSPIVSALLPIVKDIGLIAAITLVGLLLTIAFFIREEHGALSPESLRVKRLASLSAFIWLFTLTGSLFLELANLLAEPLLNAADLNSVRSFISQTAIGKSYLISIIAAVAALLTLARSKKVGSAVGAMIFAFIGVLAPIFQSHASSAGNHGIAIGSLLFHVIFISLWVGGVIGIAVINPTERELALPRFSRLAFWSAVIVAVSGAINAYSRLNFVSAWSSFYALLVGLKIALTIILIYFGRKHRSFIAAKLHGSRATFQLLISELLVMAITVALGGWLSTVQPPVANGSAIPSNALLVTGLEMPKAPTISRLFWGYIPDGTFLGLLLLATALYITGVATLRRRGDAWPVGRTISFAIGIAVADFSTSGGLGIYAHFAFSFHMVAHMLLGMIAPIAFVLSAPITLALRTLPQGRGSGERGIRGLLLSFLNSKYAIVITNPISALAIFDGSLFILYMTPLFGHLMQSHSGHLFMNIHFLAAGFLFFHVIVGIDPNPRKVPHIVRIIMLFGAMSVHAFFSIALMSNSGLIDGGFYASLHRPWFTDLHADQNLGGALGWAMGEFPILIALIATFIQWSRDDARETKRIDRAADRAAAMGEDDELAKYNKYLASLQRMDSDEN